MLAEKGYFGGDVQKILNTDGGLVLDTFNYMNFINRYKYVEFMLNKKDK